MDRAKEITSLPDYIDPEPGVYTARSNTQAYAALLAMVAAGDAVLLGERYDLNGKRNVAVEIGGFRRNQGETFNVSVRIGRNFYAGALRDYSHEWRERWWRESIQNAVDAGATEIRCSSEQQQDGNWLVTCEDNGRGMDRDTIVNKFLVLGGTTKEGLGASSTGGFGKAKELLVLPWIYWEVHSGDTLIHGAGDEGKGQTAEFRQGTRLSVMMPSDKYTEGAHALGFIRKCNIPRVRFFVNSERVDAQLRPGRLVHTFSDKAEVYYDEDDTNYSNYILVRVNGLFMFSMYLWSKKTRGVIIAELLAGDGMSASLRLLTANRDSIADDELKRGLEEFAGKLAIEAEEVLRKKEKRIREKFRGTGKFEIDKNRVRAAALESLGTLEPQGEKHGRGERELSADQIGQLVQVFRQMQPAEGVQETVFTYERGQTLAAGGLSFRIDPELIKDMLEGMPLAGPSQVEVAVKQLAWEPDFYVVNEISGFTVPKKFFPQTMTASLRKLARYWAELCRFTLIQLQCDEPFGVGFLFQMDHLAEYVHEEDEHWLMLNPFWKANPESETLDIAGPADLAELFSLALHECTHMAYNVSDHDLDFAKALTSAIGKVYGKDKQLRALKRMVLAQEKGVAEKLRAGKPKRERAARQRSAGAMEVGYQPGDPDFGGEGARVALSGGKPLDGPMGDWSPVHGRVQTQTFSTDAGGRFAELLLRKEYKSDEPVPGAAAIIYRVNLQRIDPAIWEQANDYFSPPESLASGSTYVAEYLAEATNWFTENTIHDRLLVSPFVEWAAILNERDIRAIRLDRWGW